MKPSKLKEFLQRWAISVVAVLVATYLVKGGIHYEAPLDLLVASLVLGMLNVAVRPRLLLVMNAAFDQVGRYQRVLRQ